MLRSTLYLVLFAVVSATVSATVQCGNFEKGNAGFLAKFYGYHLREQRGWSPQFFTETYVEGGLKTTISNVVNSNFRFSAEDRKIVFGKIYGYHTTISNYTLELTGYFTPTITGTHVFTIKSDNGVSLQISQVGDCCNNPPDVDYDLHEMNVRDKENGGGKIDLITRKEDMYLEEGIHYFVKVVTFNWQGNGGLEVSFVGPDSKCVSNLGSVVYQPLYNFKPCFDDAATTTILKRARKQPKKLPKATHRIVSTQKKPKVMSQTLTKSSRKLQTRTEKSSTKSQQTKTSSNIISVSSMTSSSKMVSKSSVEDSSDEESFLSSRILTTKNPVSSSLSTSNLPETTFSSSTIASSERKIELFSSVISSNVTNSVVNSSQQTTEISSSMVYKEPKFSLKTGNIPEPMKPSSSTIHTDENTVFPNTVVKSDPIYSVSNSVFEISIAPTISETSSTYTSEPESLPFVESSSIDFITSKIQFIDPVSSFPPEIESMTSFKTESMRETLGNYLSSLTTNDIDEKSPRILVPEVKGNFSSLEICFPEEKECFSNASVLETAVVTSVPDIESFSSKKVENKVFNPKVFEENAMDKTATKPAEEGNIYEDEPQTTTTIYSFITNTLETTSYTKKKPGNSTNHSGSKWPSVESYTNGCEKLKSVLEVKSLLSAFGTLVCAIAFF